VKYILAVTIILLPLLLSANDSKKLQFKTGKTIDDKQLYKVLGLQLPSWYEFWKEKTPTVNTKIISSLYESLNLFYRSEGFYHAKINKVDTNDTILFNIDEGKPSLINKINIDSDYKVLPLITFKKDKRFRSTEFVQIKKDIKKQMLKDGYCNYQLDSKANVDIELNRVNLIYTLTKQTPCIFGDISITNPKDVEKKVVKSRLAFKKGDKYSSQKISQSYSRLSGLEAFDGIQLNNNKHQNIIDIGVLLKQKAKKNRIEFGLGYETNTGPRALLRYQKRNFYGNAKKIGFDLKYSKKEKFVTGSIYTPAFIKIPKLDYYLDLKNELSYSKIEYDKFDEQKYAASLHILKDFYNFSVDLGLSYENIKIIKFADVCNISDGNFNLLFPFAKISIDYRDSKINPKNGLYFSQYIEAGLKVLQDSSTYSKSITEARAIKTVNRLTFASKIKVGLIEEFSNKLPESKLFFAGGAFSNRGYSYNALGSFDSSCDEVGGKTLIDTTLEMSYPIYQKLDAAIFLDSTLLSSQKHRFSIDFKHSIGTGIRYITPIGPVKFDFGMDLEDNSQYALHFQIGQSF
jgi:translocation and assembly module TamA